MSKFFGVLCVLLGLFVVPASAQEQYPSRQVNIVTTSPAGNPVSKIVLILGEALGPKLGVPMKPEFKTGAGGLVGADYVRKSKPDGYTLLVGSSSTILFLPVIKKVYSAADFIPVCRFGDISPFVITVPAMSPITSVADFVAHSKNTGKDGGFTYSAVGGIDSSAFLLAQQLLAIAGFKATFQAPGSQGGSIALELIRGDLDWAVTGIMEQEMLGGKVRTIAVLNKSRIPGFPDIPAITEPGLMPTLVPVPWWFGLFAPKDTPGDVVAKVGAACLAALEDEGVRTRLKNAGFTPRAGNASTFTAEIEPEKMVWENIIKEFQARGVLSVQN